VTPAIAVDGLTVRFGDVIAVDELSLSVRAGEVVALLGPNGAGKTTTVETLEGYLPPTSGTVRVLGLDPVSEATALMPRIGVMLQGGGIHRAARPGELLALYAAYYNNPRSPAELLDLVGLTDRADTPHKALSGGEAQRLSLAMALIGRPEVVFLDEPSAGVDVTGRRTIRRLIAELADEGVAVLLTTHDMEEVTELAQRVAIIDCGMLVAEGSPDELTRSTADSIRFVAPPGYDVAEMSVALEGDVREIASGDYELALGPEPEVMSRLTSWLASKDFPIEVRSGRDRLEDVFVRLTRDADATAPSTAASDSGSGPKDRRRRGKRSRRSRTGPSKSDGAGR